MDSIFLLGEGDRTSFLQHMSQSLGCTYICLWSYLPDPSNCLLFLDGIYRENHQQPSSSSSISSSRKFFHAYTETVPYVDQGLIPGFALKNNLPYIELKMHDIQRLSSHEAQLRLYQESGIQTVVLMSCAMGEIELGFSGNINIDLAMEMRNWFPSDRHHEPTNTSIQNNPSGSSSSLRSLSLSLDDSTEYNISTSPFINYNQEQLLPQQGFSTAHEAPFEGDVIRSTISPVIDTTTITTVTPPREHVLSTLSKLRSAHLPSIEDEDAVMTRAILAVLSSGNNSSSSSPRTAQINPRTNSLGAFRNYRPSSSSSGNLIATKRQNMFKRAVSYLRNVGCSRITRGLQIQENQPPMMSAQSLHHMIKERRRRQRINESFQTLRSLLPPGFKNDKASVLSSTTEHLSSLITQLEDLRRRNRALEAQVLQRREANVEDAMAFDSSSSERVRVDISQTSTSTYEQAVRFVDLRLNLRGVNMLNLMSRVLEFLRGQRNVSLLSIQSTPPQVHNLDMKLKVEGDEFDEEGFQEAVRRVVDDF